MNYPPTTRLIKCDIQTDIKGKWSDFVDGGNGCLYGIPHNARRVLQFTVEDKSVIEIGPDLGEKQHKYINGIKARNGSIYCLPDEAKYILKITPSMECDAKVCILNHKLLPGNRFFHKWKEGALAKDGCIYFLPNRGSRILKLDPSNGDYLSIVDEAIGGSNYKAAVLGSDGCIYGIHEKQMKKFNFRDNIVSTSNVGFSFLTHYEFVGGVLASNGNVYSANKSGQILKIDTTSNNCIILGNKICNNGYPGWGRPVLGADQCIYFPPSYYGRVLMFNPNTQIISLIGDSYGFEECKWRGAVLARDGFIYCIPHDADDILQLDSRHMNEQVIEFIMQTRVV